MIYKWLWKKIPIRIASKCILCSSGVMGFHSRPPCQSLPSCTASAFIKRPECSSWWCLSSCWWSCWRGYLFSEAFSGVTIFASGTHLRPFSLLSFQLAFRLSLAELLPGPGRGSCWWQAPLGPPCCCCSPFFELNPPLCSFTGLAGVVGMDCRLVIVHFDQGAKLQALPPSPCLAPTAPPQGRWQLLAWSACLGHICGPQRLVTLFPKVCP